MKTIEFTTQELEELNVILYNAKYGKSNIKYNFNEAIQIRVLRALGRPLPLSVDRTPENVAKRFMQEIQYDNGMVNRFHPGDYPQEWVELIAGALKEFFDVNPKALEELGEGTIETIAAGDEEDNPWKELPGYEKVDDVLNEYFDHE